MSAMPHTDSANYCGGSKQLLLSAVPTRPESEETADAWRGQNKSTIETSPNETGLIGGGAVGLFGDAQAGRGGSKNQFGPNAAVTPVEPEDAFTEFLKRRFFQQLTDQVVNALLEFQIFRAETVRRNSVSKRRHCDQQRVGVHPPREPLFELRLAAELIREICVIIQRRAIADDMWRACGGFEFSGDLRVKNPQLAIERGAFVHRKRRTASHFGDEINVVISFFQERAHFKGESGLADTMSTNEREFQWASPCATHAEVLTQNRAIENR